MLQQTQVATVIPYYNNWMTKYVRVPLSEHSSSNLALTPFRFPTIKDLAASDIDTVNSLWKGLGYYSRAARLLSGAQKAVKELDGRLPDNAKDMQAKIPGIGRYSAGAICSIAYNQCAPVVSLLIAFRLLSTNSDFDPARWMGTSSDYLHAFWRCTRHRKGSKHKTYCGPARRPLSRVHPVQVTSTKHSSSSGVRCARSEILRAGTALCDPGVVHSKEHSPTL